VKYTLKKPNQKPKQKPQKKRDTMTPTERKALMILKHVKTTDLAEKLGVSPSCIYLVRSNLGKSRRVEEALAKACGVPHDEMFPENRMPSAA
jgi:DNA-binding Xre family transcriptional regulator